MTQVSKPKWQTLLEDADWQESIKLKENEKVQINNSKKCSQELLRKSRQKSRM